MLLISAVLQTAGAANIVNKILYKKVLIKYSQQSIINVFLNPIKYPVKDIFIYFNNKEVTHINKNLSPHVNDQGNFLPSLSFEVQDVKDENILEIFIVLKNDMTLSFDGLIYFEKGVVVEDDIFITRPNQVFFIRAGSAVEDGIYYTLKVDNNDILGLLDEVIFNNELYYRLKAKRSGKTKVKLFKYDESLENQSDYPFRILNITSR